MIAACRCFHFADFTDHIHAGSDFTENGIAVALRGFAFEIQKVIVGCIDKNWLVAEFGSPVRAIAMVPTLFFRPLSASLLMALSVDF